MQIQEFLKQQNKEIEILYDKVQLAYWDAILSGDEKLYKKYELAALEMEKFFNNKANFEKVKGFLKEKSDEITKRQLQVLYNSYLGSQGDFELISEIVKKTTQLEKKFNTFRAKIKGKEYTGNEIKEILKKETDSGKLKEAWEASKEIGKIVEKDLSEIIKLRNKLAENLGFKNYRELSLKAAEQNSEELEKIFKELKQLTDSQFKILKSEIDSFLLKRYSVPARELKPWHYQDLFFQEGPEIYPINLDGVYNKDILEKVKQYYAGLGLDVRPILEKSDLYERKGKYPHACCMDLDRKGDVRIIQNMKNNEKWMDTTLHELGHAVYSKNYNSKLPFVLRDAAHTFTTEAIALLFGRKSKNPDFIKNYFNKNIDRELIHRSLRLRQLVFARWTQVLFYFEKSLYENPGQDLNKLWWELVKEYQLVNFSRNAPDYASKIHVVTAPIYYHNYMLGELLASQLHNYILKNLSPKTSDYSNDKEVSKFLIEKIFSVGKTYPWNKMIKQATGEELTARYFVEEFC